MTAADPGLISVWRWRAIAWALVFAIAMGAVAISPFSERLPWPALIRWLVALLAVVLLLRAWLWPPVAYRHMGYCVDEHGIAIQRGVLWRSHVSLPRIRIQHTDLSQGPLQRRYGIATLTFYTAGNRFTTIELPGLAFDVAAGLRDALLAEAEGHAV